MNQLTPVTKNIIILNVIVYLAANFLMDGKLYEILSGFYPESPNFHSWQIITHMFMHAQLGGGFGIMHIIFNMFTLWSFGPVLEQTLGEKKFVWLYFLSGIGGFVLFNLWNFYEINQITTELKALGVNVADIYKKSSFSYIGEMNTNATSARAQELSQNLFDSFRIKMVGASGAIFGIVAAFSTLFPEAKLMFMFIPFPIKAKYLFPLIIIGSLYLGFSGDGSGIAHFAHIGGALVGWIFVKLWKKNRFRIN